MNEAPNVTSLLDRECLTIDGFLTPEECRAWIDLGEEQGFQFATVGGTEWHEYRNNSRVNLTDRPRADALYERAQPFLPRHEDGRVAVGFNDHLKLYRYHPGEHFDWHGDGTVRFEDGRSTAYTFLVYLNDGCEGGETSFRVGAADRIHEFAVAPRQGTALCFQHRLLHRGEEVRSGEKYVLRTDVIYDDLRA